MKKLAYTISILLLASSAFAQDLTDGLRYSNYHISGTARSAAMGNAFGALGGDFTSLSINPAGIGVYRAGEITITPSIGNISTDGTFLSNKVNDSRYNFGFNNLGYVATIPTGDNSESGLVSLSFGLGFNRMEDLSFNRVAQGANSNHSLLTYFTDNVNSSGLAPSNFDPYYERLAYDTYLINYDKDNKEYYNNITDNKYGQSQRKSTQQRGYINEYVLSMGANFNHKFYLGATIGIQDVYAKEDANLYEWDAKNNIPYFNEFNFNTYLKTTGSGFNFKLGAIYKPTDQLRLGIAFHTPTFYRFTEDYDSYMNSSISYSDGTENYKANPDQPGTYDYKMQTPFKTIFSGAYIIGKSALISVDYELVDYSTIKLKDGSNGYDYYGENQDIKSAYKTTGNLHVGGEYRVNPNFSVRAGYENYGNPYNAKYNGVENPNSDNSYSTISAGLGFKQGNFFIDTTYKRISYDEHLKAYIGSPNMVYYEAKQNNFIITFGYKF